MKWQPTDTSDAAAHIEALEAENARLRVALERSAQALDAAFLLMNAYAQDPHNMGGDARNLASISPHGVLAEVYAILAPAQIATRALLTATEETP